MYLGSGWWGDVEGFHYEGSAELENDLRRNKNLRYNTDFTLLLYFSLAVCTQEIEYLCRAVQIENIPLLTRAILKNVVRLQLKGHDHTVKPSQLCRRYQHSAESVRFTHMHIHTYLYSLHTYKNTLHVLYSSHLISLRRSSFSGLSKIAKRGRTKSSITLSDKNWVKD